MTIWDEIVARPLRALRLDRIRNRILALALVAALVPTVVIAVTSYRRERRMLGDAVAQELRRASAEAARETDQWLEQRVDDLRLRASSYVVSENVARIPDRDGAQALGRLREYLASARERSPDHDALLVLDSRGRVLASTGRAAGVRVPQDRLNGLRTGDAFVDDAYWDAGLGKAAIVLALPIRDPEGRFLGALAAKVNLGGVADILRRLAPEEPGDLYLMTGEGRLVMRARASSAGLMRTRLSQGATGALLDGEGQVVAYQRAQGPELLGVLRRVPRPDWAAVAELPRAEALARATRLRNAAVLLAAALFGGVGLAAFGAGLLIARPLERLSRAAAKLSAGDLAVDLPAGGSGEVGYLTRAFGHVVVRLREREGQGELERLSVTDALTGLYNRRHLVGTLATEVQRSRRLRRTFSVLMADVDHFKQYNDAHGHLAGDAALVKIAEILRKTTRGVDCVARYGGEEFMVMLLETTVTVAVAVGERIRTRVEAEEFEGRRITVSLGVAEYPPHGDTPEELIASADAAMYQAKREGRNRVVVAGGRAGGAGGEPEAEPEAQRRRKGGA